MLVEKEKISTEQKDQTLANISVVSSLNEAAAANLIIEAIVENTDVKVSVFRELDEASSDDTILASNTSSISITKLAAAVSRPEQFIGLHYMNPVPVMKLVEVIRGLQTSDDTYNASLEFVASLGKTAVTARRDYPGFIVNRVARHFYVEGLKILEENVADHAAIDRLVESSGFKMGPFKLMDLIGVDTNYSVTESMFESFRYRCGEASSNIVIS